MPRDVDVDVQRHFARLTIYTLIILHRVSKNVPPLACYNFDADE